MPILHPGGSKRVKTRVIEIIPDHLENVERLIDLDIRNGFVEADPVNDIMKHRMRRRAVRSG